MLICDLEKDHQTDTQGLEKKPACPWELVQPSSLQPTLFLRKKNWSKNFQQMPYVLPS